MAVEGGVAARRQESSQREEEIFKTENPKTCLVYSDVQKQ